MNKTEIGAMARSLRQTAESLRRAGVRHHSKLRRASRADNAPVAPVLASLDASSVMPAPFDAGESDRIDRLKSMANEVAGCRRCAELARCRKNTVFGVGDPQAQLCFVGEAPGADEDTQGEPFVGAAGQLLTKIIIAMGLERRQVYICNVLKCRPPGNRTPAPDEVANCRGFLELQIEIIRPKFICALGAVAAKTLLESTLSIGKLRGRFHDFRGTPVLCTYHPAYLLRNPEAKKDVWEDVKILMRQMGLPVREN